MTPSLAGISAACQLDAAIGSFVTTSDVALVFSFLCLFKMIRA